MAEVVGIIHGVQTHVWSVGQCGGEHRGQEASQPYPPVPTACLASLHPLSVLFLSFPFLPSTSFLSFTSTLSTSCAAYITRSCAARSPVYLVNMAVACDMQTYHHESHLSHRPFISPSTSDAVRYPQMNEGIPSLSGFKPVCSSIKYRGHEVTVLPATAIHSDLHINVLTYFSREDSS